jgi:hypothetical protein
MTKPFVAWSWWTGKASIRARLRQKRTPLRTNEQRMVALERAVASLDDGESSIKTSQSRSTRRHWSPSYAA